MSIKIDSKLCSGCLKTQEPPCVKICPGDLLLRQRDKATIREPKNCWDCGACLKACPNQAIAMYLPAQVGGKGANLTAKNFKKKTVWICTWPSGKKEVFEVEAEKII